jgi:hypothetical protein
MYAELADTLIAVVEALSPPAGSGLHITEAEIDLPLEVSGAEHKGKLIFLATPPHTLWISGVLPRVHMSTLRIEVGEAGK